MQITHLGHSTLLLATGSTRVLVDPGVLTAGWENTRELDAVLVTHAHVDHIDWSRLPALLEANPGLGVHLEPELAGSEQAAALAASGTAVTSIGAGWHGTFGDLQVQADGGRHALIHEDIPQIGNVGLIFRDAQGQSLFHPGDALDVIPEDVDVLAVPVSAPWCAGKETVEFMRAVGARAAVPIHDGLLAPAGRGIYLNLLSGQGRTRIQDLGDGRPWQP